MRVRVTEKHITSGVQRNSQRCMIADAIKSACPKAQFVMVDLQTIRFSDPRKRKRLFYLTPAIAQQNLLKFDQGKQVKPFAFTLADPVRSRPMLTERRSTPAQTASARKSDKTYRKNKKRADYAYLAANRARNHQKEREFGLRKFSTH
jgi:hypothetical protein